MSDEKTMTAEEAWAEVDQLNRYKNDAAAEADRYNAIAQTAQREVARRHSVFAAALSAAEAIGPRPVKVPS